MRRKLLRLALGGVAAWLVLAYALLPALWDRYEHHRGFERSLPETGGELLCVSQFTLLGDVRRGNRPSWSAAAPPELAAPLVEAYADAVAALGVPVRRGRFGALMAVSLVNDGPVTLVLDSGSLAQPRREA